MNRTSNSVRVYAVIGIVAALWSLVFASYSTLDYASHLDRGLHDLHCSLIPGADAAGDPEGCRTAFNSPYSAVFKQRLWGGIPISLFALGCFSFLLGHASYMAVRGRRVTGSAGGLYCLLATSPLLVSAGMFAISWFELGTICKTCAGIYIGSLLMAISGVGVFASAQAPASASGIAKAAATVSTLMGILLWSLAPSVVYAAMVPDHEPFVTQCGSIQEPKEKHGALLSLAGAHPKKKALFFEDPLCPTCKSLHDRLAGAGLLDNLDVDLALFPLDNECNWMLQQPLHPGACQVSRAIICGDNPGAVLDWAYANQADLTEAGKRSEDVLVQLIERRWGAKLVACMRSKKTTQRLNRHLHFAADNAVLVSTPQIFIEGQRLCDEDIDMGLMFALKKIAPEVLP